MLAIQAQYHDGHIQIPTEGLPRDAKVVVVFLEAESANTPNTPNTPNTHKGLNPDQQAALHLQSQSSFAQTVLLNPAEDCWNNA